MHIWDLDLALFFIKTLRFWSRTSTGLHLFKVDIFEVDIVFSDIDPTKQVVLSQHVPDRAIVDMVSSHHVEDLHLVNYVTVNYGNALWCSKMRGPCTAGCLAPQNPLVVLSNCLFIPTPLLDIFSLLPCDNCRLGNHFGALFSFYVFHFWVC